MSGPKRNTGILSEADIEALGSDYFEENEIDRNHRYRLRQKLKNALIDMSFISDGLSNKDVRLVFEEVIENYGDTVPATSSLLFRGLQEVSGDEDDLERTSELLESVLNRGFQEGARQSGKLIDVDISVDVELREPNPEVLSHNVMANSATLGELVHLLTNHQREGQKLLKKVSEKDKVKRLSIRNTEQVYELTPKKAEMLLAQRKED